MRRCLNNQGERAPTVGTVRCHRCPTAKRCWAGLREFSEPADLIDVEFTGVASRTHALSGGSSTTGSGKSIGADGSGTSITSGSGGSTGIGSSGIVMRLTCPKERRTNRPNPSTTHSGCGFQGNF